jgi:hypothetical protein
MIKFIDKNLKTIRDLISSWQFDVELPKEDINATNISFAYSLNQVTKANNTFYEN